MTHPIFKKIGRAHRPEISAVTVKAGDHTITISGEALAALVDLAERRGETLGQVLAEAIGVQRTIVEATEKGGRVIIESKDDKPRELVLAS